MSGRLATTHVATMATLDVLSRSVVRSFGAYSDAAMRVERT